MTLPFQAVECFLANITPLQGKCMGLCLVYSLYRCVCVWSVRSTKEMRYILGSRSGGCKFESQFWMVIFSPLTLVSVLSASGVTKNFFYKEIMSKQNSSKWWYCILLFKGMHECALCYFCNSIMLCEAIRTLRICAIQITFDWWVFPCFFVGNATQFSSEKSFGLRGGKRSFSLRKIQNLNSSVY